MRAMVFDRYGEPDVVHLKDVPIPEPEHGEVLIRVGYSRVNPSDSKTRAGATRAHYRYLDFPTGLENLHLVRSGANVPTTT